MKQIKLQKEIYGRLNVTLSSGVYVGAKELGELAQKRETNA